MQIVTVDARNHGESEHSPEMNYFLQSLDVCNLFQELEISKAVVMGHSMGGKTAMTFSLSHPESVDSLIVVDMSPTKLSLDEDIPRYLAAKRAMNLNLIRDKRDAEKMLVDVVPVSLPSSSSSSSSFSEVHNWQLGTNVHPPPPNSVNGIPSVSGEGLKWVQSTTLHHLP